MSAFNYTKCLHRKSSSLYLLNQVVFKTLWLENALVEAVPQQIDFLHFHQFLGSLGINGFWSIYYYCFVDFCALCNGLMSLVQKVCILQIALVLSQVSLYWVHVHFNCCFEVFFGCVINFLFVVSLLWFRHFYRWAEASALLLLVMLASAFQPVVNMAVWLIMAFFIILRNDVACRKSQIYIWGILVFFLILEGDDLVFVWL